MTPDALAELLRTRELELHATREALAKARSEYGMALDGIARLVGASGQEDAVERTLETVRVLLGASEAFLLVSVNETSGFVRASTHQRWTLFPRWEWQGVFARAHRGRAALVHQPERLPAWSERPSFQRDDVGSLLVAPVTLTDDNGVFVAVHRETGAFDRATLDRARSIAPVLGAALATARRWRSRVATEKARYLAVEADQAMLRHRYELLVSAMDSAVLMESADGLVNLVNPAFLRLFNLHGRASVMHEPARRVEAHAAALFANPEGFLERSRMLSAAEGMQFDELQMADGRVLERSTRQVLDADDRVGRIWVYRDVTSRVLSNRALADALGDMERNDTRRQQSLAQLSHEIRSPVQSILTMTEALRSADLTPELSDLVHAVRGSSTQITHLLTDLLDLSRLESGKVRIRTRMVDPGEIVEEVVESFGARAAGKRLGLRVSVSPHVGVVDTDPDRIRQVVTNLVANAIKYTSRGGIRVAVERDGPNVQIHVHDSGHGMSQTQQDHLFEEYGQVRGATQASAGVGLGLYISHRLVQRLGGVLTVQSPPGKGSRFTVSLPAAETPAAHVDQRPEMFHLSGLSEEDERMVQLQCACLGIQVSSAADASHVLVQESPDHPRPPGLPGQFLVAAVDVGESTPEWAHAAVRGPITRPALLRALKATAAVAREDDTAPVPLCGAAAEAAEPLEIIIADDDPTVRHLLKHFLCKLTPTPNVRLAETGAEAVTMFRASRADVVLLDSEMPVMHGGEAAVSIRRLESTVPAAAPCMMIALTGHEDPEHHAGLRHAGVDRVFTKPVHPVMLIQLLTALQQSTAPHARECG